MPGSFAVGLVSPDRALKVDLLFGVPRRARVDARPERRRLDPGNKPAAASGSAATWSLTVQKQAATISGIRALWTFT
jgi:hypothetical protein